MRSTIGTVGNSENSVDVPIVFSWLPVGFSLLGGMYEAPYCSFSSSSIKSMYASMIACSLAFSSSAIVLKPVFVVSSTMALPRSVPLAQPFVAFILRVAASAMTCRISWLRLTEDPPSF